MASIYKKKAGTRLWCRLKGRKGDGKWGSYPTPYRIGEEKEAERWTVRAQANIDKRNAIGLSGAQTVASYSRDWLARRERDGVASVRDERGRINNHVIPAIGDMKLSEVRGRHVADLVRALNRNEDLAPRTVLNIYGVMRTMFRDVERDELIEKNPCDPPPPELPEKVDKDPEWRHQAVWEMQEVVSLITDPRIPAERRVQYAMKSLAGLRHGEVAGLRWRNWDETEVPLTKMSVARSYNNKRTKTKVTRQVPVHPELARVLRLWRSEHWPRVYGRVHAADDLIVPTRTQKPVSANDAVRYLKDDLDTLGLRRSAGEHRERGGHDLRAWFITTCLEHGASIEALMRVTHTKPKDVISGYTRLPYPALCSAVSCLPIALVEDPLTVATDLATRERNAQKRWKKMATPTGFEGVQASAKHTKRSASGDRSTKIETACDVSLALMVANPATGQEPE